MPIYQEVL